MTRYHFFTSDNETHGLMPSGFKASSKLFFLPETLPLKKKNIVQKITWTKLQFKAEITCIVSTIKQIVQI